MNWRAGTKAGLNSTLKEALPGCVNVSQQRAGEGQCLAPLRVCKAYFCLSPLKLLSFALVCTVGIRLHDGHHAPVCLHNDCGAGARLCGPALGWRGRLKYLFGMALGDAGNGAFTEHDAIVLNEFVHGLGKGLVSTEVGDYAL